MRYVEKYCRAGWTTDDKIIQHMRTACWIPKATDTNSEYVILITFLLQQWLHEHVSMLRYMYNFCKKNMTQKFQYIFRLFHSPPPPPPKKKKRK
jgi:hypothetical protein